MNTRHLICSLATASLSMLAIVHSRAQSNYYSGNNATFLINTQIADSAVVGYANQAEFSSRQNGTSPTINLVNGGIISGNMLAYNQSRINISGGRIDFTLETYDSSTINISSGSISTLATFGSSTVNLSGGSITFNLIAQYSSAVNIFGGRIDGSLFTYDTSTVNIFGSRIGGNLDAASTLRRKFTGSRHVAGFGVE